MLGTIKVLNIKLATFVFALGTIVNDLKEFALVMTIVVLMFSCIFLILHAEGTSVIAGDDGDDVVDDDLFADTRPFQYFGFSALTVFMMIMGDFSQDMFETNDFRLSVFSLWMFVVFMFFVVRLPDITFSGWNYPRNLVYYIVFLLLRRIDYIEMVF